MQQSGFRPASAPTDPGEFYHFPPFIFNIFLTLNIPSLALQRCLSSWGPRRTPWFFGNFSTVWCGRLLKLCFLGFWNYNSVVQALLASNILCLFISTEVTVGTELLHTQSSLIQHLNNVIFLALTAGHFSNLQLSEPKNNPKCVFNFLHFFLKEQFISLIT